MFSQGSKAYHPAKMVSLWGNLRFRVCMGVMPLYKYEWDHQHCAVPLVLNWAHIGDLKKILNIIYTYKKNKSDLVPCMATWSMELIHTKLSYSWGWSLYFFRCVWSASWHFTSNIWNVKSVPSNKLTAKESCYILRITGDYQMKWR